MWVVPYLAEFMGTFALLLSIFATGNFAVIGATLALVIFLIGGVSGGHVNPAVSLAMYVKGSLSVTELVGYAVSQLLGAVAGFYTYKALA
jgi:aquaporin Z